MKASILIVTRNRAADLKETLAAMLSVRIPAGADVELVVVDNGSTDETARVVETHVDHRLSIKYILEPKAGKSNGLNRGIAGSTGEMVLFTDDDVRPPPEWLEAMCEPIFNGTADVIAGGMKLAPHLLRPWMAPLHRAWLASSEWLTPGAPESLVGANMAVSKEVFKRVPGFDPELGPGALGFGEDGLFFSQLQVAGYRFTDRLDVCLEHHLDPARLTRRVWLETADKQGYSHAYRGHHWEHWGCRFGHLKVLRARMELSAWRARHQDMIWQEGVSETELGLVNRLAMLRGHLKESRRERNFQREGLVKLR